MYPILKTKQKVDKSKKINDIRKMKLKTAKK